MLLFTIEKFVVAAIFIFGIIMPLAGLHGWVERKQSALMQDRMGANRANFFGYDVPLSGFKLIKRLGLFHMPADVLKLVFKEDFTPPGGDRKLHTLAPMIALFFALAGFAALPYGHYIYIGQDVPLQVAPMNVGLLFVFAMMSMAVYGVFLAGFSSNNNFSFLGGLRASSQMISYEITMGVTVIGVIMIFQTVDLQVICIKQGYLISQIFPNTPVLKYLAIPAWGFLLQPVGCILFMTAAVAETKRAPFDLPEGESEIIGFDIEYSGLKFAMFMTADFVETVLAASLTVVLFFGGWQVPYLIPAAGGMNPAILDLPLLDPIAVPHYLAALLQVVAFIFKVLCLCWLFMTIRWTLPRFRYDQLMRLGWKMMLPASLIWIVITALAIRLAENLRM